MKCKHEFTTASCVTSGAGIPLDKTVCHWCIKCGKSKGELQAEAEVERLASAEKEAIEQAFMAGQAREGVDPSYSEAQSYYEEWKAQKEGVNG